MIEINKYTSDIITKITELKSKIEKLESKSSKLFDLYLDGNLEKSMLVAKTNEIKIELDEFKSQLINYETKPVNKYTEEKIVKYLNHCKEDLNSLDPHLQRKVILEFVDSITIYEDKIEINLIIKGDESNVKDRVNGAKPCLTLSLISYR